MRIACLVCLGVCGFLQHSFLFSATGEESLIHSYPWSETSESVRVGKELLERIPFRSVVVTNFNSMQFVLRPEFVATMLLTVEEVERVQAALTFALHEFRTLRGHHFEAVTGNSEFDTGLTEKPYASGTFTFRLNPFELEAAAIRERLKKDILRLLGPQRARFFWLEGEAYLDGEMNTTKQARFASETHCFSLMTNDPGPLVDIKILGTSGSSGRPYGEELDQYAPEKLKPILKGWRDWIATKPRGSFQWVAPRSEDGVLDPSAYAGRSRWDDASEYVDLPKPVAGALGVPGLTDMEELSPELIALLGLTPKDVLAVMQFYHKMKGQVEDLERANLVRHDPTKTSFVIRPFPDQVGSLKREWLTTIKGLLGSGRGELLDRLVHTPRAISLGRLRHLGKPDFLLTDTGPRWFDRGIFEIRIDIETVIGPAGREIRRFSYESDSPESGSTGGARVRIPERFRHVLTPEMLGVKEQLPKLL